MGMNVGNGDGLQAEINVTPLVDVVLVLLIIFMVIIPLSMRGYDVAISREQGQVLLDGPHTPRSLVLAELLQEGCERGVGFRLG